MQLDGEKLKQLQDALLSAFPDQGELEQLVRFKLNESLNTIAVANGANYSYVIFKLITWAESEGKLRELISAGCSEKPGNSQLMLFCEQLRQQQATTKQSYRLMNPCTFDLGELIRSCLNILEDKQGLVGLAVPYNQDPFLIYFCERLKERIGKSHTDNKQPLTLDNYRTSVDTAVTTMKRYKKLLQKGDVICPIRVAVSDPNSSHEFWKKISAEFQDPQNSFEHRFIIIMVSSEYKFFPQGVTQLTPPQFTKADAHEWILEVTDNLGWREEDRNKWKRYMIDECLESECLNIRSVYEHLDHAIKLLQQNHTAEAFLQELEI
ncbi:MAG: hypothetical protein KME49_24910 [Brasilonema octagenarum HA4186-MV1]|jgi:hypothetical protein|uniref:Effector-associated domain-containing protein n=2 Tax=Brasilonema TaxID=383614 RepID=A0A856M9F5_9CYAN|nr:MULTISPECIES: effector-associated domain EAD1-containing protein [Brasilonema]MBW4628666.1 hypothetical protein [Brasilonema octagenarum HA4186-MV1]NMF63452.1 hypothetical protein [Brasilonema octagenarum UFV-OR1]QDL07352.1 hypothetical protein DP114_05050 [Brasilonema sennae CENA114]QDL13714.1 hypothetical protein DP113_05000 [Brasilonema octagenarum UFV-E1]